MNLLVHWVATPLAQALGWTLLHSLWEGALIALALAGVLAATRSARARYGAACLALGAMVGALGLTLARVLPEAAHGAYYPATALPSVWAGPAEGGAALSWFQGLARWVPWLAPFWVAGAWIFVLRQLAGWMALGRLRRRGVCWAPEPWQDALLRLRAQLRLSRPVQLLESCLAEVPMVVGHLRPVILVPLGLLTGFPAPQVEAILLHELAHIRRHDYLVNLLERTAESLLFYHPAAWWMARVIRAERENCCDDVVVHSTGSVREYATALAALEQFRCRGPQPAAAATGGNLMKRIRRLLEPQGAAGVWSPLAAALILLATAALAAASWQTQQPQRSPSAPSQAARAESSPYEQWRSEVAYIINKEELAAFQKLTTNEERDKFIEQFWERRNPNPGSPHNEFKEEFYRRIAYANAHYASTLPGWKTDRGRIYIMYGPPDQIESRRAQTPHPTEEWLYREIKGVGSNVIMRFVDLTGKGDYHLAQQGHFHPKLRAGGS
jgi:GWxTD domain-containing protein